MPPDEKLALPPPPVEARCWGAEEGELPDAKPPMGRSAMLLLGAPPAPRGGGEPQLFAAGLNGLSSGSEFRLGRDENDAVGGAATAEAWLSASAKSRASDVVGLVS